MRTGSTSYPSSQHQSGVEELLVVVEVVDVDVDVDVDVEVVGSRVLLVVVVLVLLVVLVLVLVLVEVLVEVDVVVVVIHPRCVHSCPRYHATAPFVLARHATSVTLPVHVPSGCRQQPLVASSALPSVEPAVINVRPHEGENSPIPVMPRQQTGVRVPVMAAEIHVPPSASHAACVL